MKVLSRVSRWSWLACIPGGVLWALSPLGVHLSELKFKTPDVFWKLFPSAPLLLALGLTGLYLLQDNYQDWLTRFSFWVALAGIALIVAGDVGLFYLGVDDTYIMTAPAYRAFRAGLLLFSAGSLLFALVVVRVGTLSLLSTFPLIVGSLGGLVSFARDLGPLGAVLWTSFGLAWAWAGLLLLIGELWPRMVSLGLKWVPRA